MFWRVVERGGRWFPLVKQTEGGKWQTIAKFSVGFADREAALQVAREMMGRMGGSFYDERWTPDAKILARWEFLKWLDTRGAFDQDKTGTSLTVAEVLSGQL